MGLPGACLTTNMKVADSSAISKVFLRERGWENVFEYFKKESVLTLNHALKEVANAIWKQYRSNKIEASKAIILFNLLKEFIKSGIILLENDDLYLEKAFKLAIEKGLPFYSSLFLVFALEKRATLLTSDPEKAKDAKAVGLDFILL